MITVTDAEMAYGARLAATHLSQTVELAAGGAIHAAVHRISKDCRRVGVILCGGNVGTE